MKGYERLRRVMLAFDARSRHSPGWYQLAAAVRWVYMSGVTAAAHTCQVSPSPRAPSSAPTLSTSALSSWKSDCSHITCA
eukprot:1188205-Prorocentrum_minimum.AAC.4